MKNIFCLLVILFSSFVFAHSGRTDTNGCHNDRKNGGYHCHKSDDQSVNAERTVSSEGSQNHKAKESKKSKEKDKH